MEFTDGYIEILAMPTEAHQLILIFLFDALRAFVRPRKLGLVHGVFKPRQKATSVLLPGFTVSVSAIFKAAEAAGS